METTKEQNDADHARINRRLNQSREENRQENRRDSANKMIGGGQGALKQSNLAD